MDLMEIFIFKQIDCFFIAGGIGVVPFWGILQDMAAYYEKKHYIITMCWIHSLHKEKNTQNVFQKHLSHMEESLLHIDIQHFYRAEGEKNVY